MDHLLARLAALAAASALLAGCLMEGQQSTRDDDADDGNVRRLAVDVPAGATSIQIDVDARAQAGEPDVTILIEDEAGNNLATDTFSVSGSMSRSLSATVSGQDRLLVTVRVVDGDASLDVRVRATVPGQPDVVVIRETIVVHAAPTPASPDPTPDPTPEPTPATTPTPTVTPTATPPTNTTTNATNTTD